MADIVSAFKILIEAHPDAAVQAFKAVETANAAATRAASAGAAAQQLQTKSTEQLIGAMQGLTQTLSRNNELLSKGRQETEHTAAGMTELNQALEVAGKAWNRLGQAAQFAIGAMAAGGNFQEQKTAFDQVAAQYGIDPNRVVSSLTEVASGTITRQQAMGIGTKLITSSLSEGDIETVATFAKRMSEATGRPFEELSERISTAMASGRMTALRELGLVADESTSRAQAVEQMAKRLESLKEPGFNAADSLKALAVAGEEAYINLGRGMNSSAGLQQSIMDLQKAAKDAVESGHLERLGRFIGDNVGIGTAVGAGAAAGAGYRLLAMGAGSQLATKAAPIVGSAANAATGLAAIYGLYKAYQWWNTEEVDVGRMSPGDPSSLSTVPVELLLQASKFNERYGGSRAGGTMARADKGLLSQAVEQLKRAHDEEKRLNDESIKDREFATEAANRRLERATKRRIETETEAYRKQTDEIKRELDKRAKELEDRQARQGDTFKRMQAFEAKEFERTGKLPTGSIEERLKRFAADEDRRFGGPVSSRDSAEVKAEKLRRFQYEDELKFRAGQRSETERLAEENRKRLEARADQEAAKRRADADLEAGDQEDRALARYLSGKRAAAGARALEARQLREQKMLESGDSLTAQQVRELIAALRSGLEIAPAAGAGDDLFDAVLARAKIRARTEPTRIPARG